MKKTAFKVSAAVAVLALAGVACSTKETGSTGAPKAAAGNPAKTDSAAGNLAVTLTNALSEHVWLAAVATNAALAGNGKSFEAAAAALDGNSNDIAAAVGSVYGKEAQDAFSPLWKKHIGFFVSYTQGVAAKDTAKTDKAVSDLLAYATEFAAFLESATDKRLPKDAGTAAVKEHILTLKAVVDAQAAKDFTTAYSSLGHAYRHMRMIGVALGGAIDDQKSLDGSVTDKPVDLRLTLNQLLTEHVWAASSATGQALSGNEAGFKGAAATLDKNSDDLSAAIGSVYGKDAQDAFSPLWKKHIGFFVDYTQGVAAKDKAKMDKAVADLTAYASEFGAFLESATDKGLPKDAVASLVTSHILGLKDVVDAQAAKDFTTAYAKLRDAAGHMGMIADPLAATIVKQMPEKFA
jgi:hypothetical protein